MKLDIPSIVGYRDADEIVLHAVMQIEEDSKMMHRAVNLRQYMWT
jgi:hypothetical protein